MSRYFYLKLLAAFAVFLAPILGSAQTTVSIYATGTTGSYNTGSVSDVGNKLDGNLDSISIGNPAPFYTPYRGWAKFDLSSIPAGATITSAILYFTTYNGTTSSGAVNTITGFLGNPATMTGVNLYNAIAAGTTINSSSWTANGLQTQPLNPTGVTFVQTNLGSSINVGFMRVGYLAYYIYGYPAATADQPRLDITYTVTTPCSGITSVTATGPANICAGTSFTLASATMPAAAGYSFQWQSSPASANTWTDITGATSSNYTGMQSAATDYRVVVSCSSASSVDTSNVVAVAQNNFNTCYCPATVSYIAFDDITNVSLGAINNASACASLTGSQGTATGGTDIYSDFTGSTVPVPSLMQGISQTLNVTLNSCSGSSTTRECKAYIDYNQNGLFTDPGEEIVVYPYGNPNATVYTASVTFTVPLTATLGNTRMRIMLGEAQGSIVSPCSVLNSYGEAEDYTVNITQQVACTGTPVAGGVMGVDSVCPNMPFTLVDTGYTTATGLSFQWEMSPNGAGIWTPIAGATNASYTETAGITAPTDYHVVVTCTNGGGTDITGIHTVYVKTLLQCYCVPSGANISYGINNFSTTGAVGNINNLNSGYSPTGYGNFTGSQTLSVVPGGSPVNFTASYLGSGYTYGFAMFIDYNQNGSFGDAGELIYNTTGYSSSASGSFTVPATTPTGNTRMRIVANYNNSNPSNDYCATAINGEFEDYSVNVIALTPCAGVPTGGVAFAPDSVCAGAPFLLQDTAFTIGSGITYQWQESPAGAGVWTDIVGATGTSYTVSAGITAPMDYQLLVTCTNGGATAVSSTTTVNLNAFYVCYCSPLTGTTLHTYGYNYITNVSITGTSLNHPSSTVGAGGYSQYYPTIPSSTTTLSQGVQYTLNATAQYTGYPISGWVDFDGSGTFDAGEYVAMTPDASGYVYSGTFIIPFGGVSGSTGVRLRLGYTPGYTATQACYNYSSGYETEDYVVNVTVPPACAGTPTAGVAFGADSVCANASFLLSDTAYTIASGITFQWESSPMGAGVWSAISGATTPNYVVSAGQTTATDYRLVITCSNGGGTDISNVLSIGMNSFYKCYCSSAASYTSDEEILNVTVGSFSNSSTCTTVAPGPGSIQNRYSNYTTLPPVSVSQGSTVMLNVQIGTCNGNYSNWTKVYIDYNQNGDYSDPGEEVYSSTNYTSGAHLESGAVTIPITATAGVTGMRVINVETTSGSGVIPCGMYGYGETEDYLIDIAAAAACNGTPSAGNAYGPDSMCASIPFTLSDTNVTIGLGVTYQWEESPYGAGVWSPISGATNPFYTVAAGITTPMDYHLVVTCTNGGGQDISNIVSVSGIYPATQCYCIPSGASGTYSINNFSTTGGVININNTNSGLSAGGYGNFTNMVVNAIPGTTVNFTASFAPSGYTYGFALWVDWGADGSFAQPGDLVYNTTGYSSSASGSFLVPLTATTGSTRIRITADYLNGNPSSEYCSASNSGTFSEWEDYTLTIAPPPSCLPPTGLAATNVTTTSADLAWTENGTATQWSIEYGPTGFTQGSGTYVSAPTNPYTLSGLSAGTAYDIYVKSICSTTDSSFVNGPVNINTAQIPVSSYPYSINWDNGGGGWTYANGNQPNKWFVGAPGQNPAGTFGPSAGGLYVSNDGGVTNGYNNTSTTYVHAYRDLDLTSFSAAIPLTFNSYIVGELPNWDYLSVWMVPMTYDPIPGTDMSTSGGTQIGSNINGESGWTQHLLNIPASYAGTMARLVLQWHNDGSSGSAPVKVDNLTIGGFPLVIKLRDISATNLGAKNRIDWSTESELKSDKFELERSADGRNFTYLATISAKGEASNYSYVDISPVTGVNYYRLKMIDAAGTVATSKVVTATVKQGAFTVEAYPNPVNEKLTVQVYGGSDQNATVSITDVTGKVMKVVNVVNGKAEVNMNGLASGVYLVKYTDNNHSQIIKVNKQ